MSDLEKIVSYATEKLGSGTPIQLRWEGAGDARHPAAILNQLKYKKYSDNTPIKYNAVINIFEAEGSDIHQAAIQHLQFSQGWGANENQTYSLYTGVDVTRGSQSLNQPKAHIIFVRNIMPTNELDESLTHDSDGLFEIHSGALRGRSNSIETGGKLRLGMSGAPGLISDSLNNRRNTPVSSLFVGAKELVKTARESGLTVSGSPTRTGQEDVEEGTVMKNIGTSLTSKTTFYLTFVK